MTTFWPLLHHVFTDRCLENETMKKVEKLLGNGVSLEAALKFQERFYHDFVAYRGLASGVKQ